MKKTPVTSSNIEWVAYNADARKLFIGFYSGNTYSYTPITQVGYQNFLEAPSIGSYFHHHIKDNPTISCEQVDPENLVFD
jgi:hypothetical protein